MLVVFGSVWIIVCVCMMLGVVVSVNVNVVVRKRCDDCVMGVCILDFSVV